MAGTSGGRPSIYPTLLYADAKAAIRQLTEAFGFTEVAVYEGEDGSVLHAELAQGNGMVMLGSQGHRRRVRQGDGGRGPGRGVRRRGRRGRAPRAGGGARRGDPDAARPTRTTARGTTWPGTPRATSGASGRTPRGRGLTGGHGRGGPTLSPPVCTWKAARRTALASAGSGWAAASATRTCTVRG